jgi:hypothetical protein
LARVSDRAAPRVQLGSTAPGPIGTTVWNFRRLYVLAVEIA